MTRQTAAIASALAGLALSRPALAEPVTTNPAMLEEPNLLPHAGLATATSTFDIAGLGSWDEQGDIDNVVLTRFLAPGAQIIGVGFDVSISTEGFSWLSDPNFGIENSDQSAGVFQTPGAGSDFSGTTSFDSGGIIDLTALAVPSDFALNPDGMVRIELYEAFDDDMNAIDATFGSGSEIQVRYIIPAPASTTLLALGSLVATRRRRG